MFRLPLSELSVNIFLKYVSQIIVFDAISRDTSDFILHCFLYFGLQTLMQNKQRHFDKDGESYFNFVKSKRGFCLRINGELEMFFLFSPIRVISHFRPSKYQYTSVDVRNEENKQ